MPRESTLPTSRWRNTGLVIGISVALGVWILYQAGCLEAWDGAFYDRFFSWTLRWREPQPKVLLLRLEREDAWSDDAAITTLNLLEGLGARAVVVNFVPHRNSAAFFQQSAALKNVMFARQLRPDPNDPDLLRLEAWPAVAREQDLPWGVAFLPPSVKGVHRWQQTHVTVGTNTYPLLERRAAALCDPTLIKPGVTGPYLINFAGGPGAIPNVSLSRVLAGELIGEMVKGRVVLIGRDDGLVGLETPVSGGAETMSLLEFQGNAIQTLLDGTPIQRLPWFYLLAALVGLSIATALLYQRVSSISGARMMLAILLISTLAAFGAMSHLHYWIALGPLVLAQVGQFALTLVFKARMTNLAVTRMRLRALNQIEERFTPASILGSGAYWDQLASMIHQTLDVGRMAFFERVPHTQQLRETKAFNCKFEEMREKQRTLDTPVFSAALAKEKAIRVSGLFESGQAPEAEYLCPLRFAGEVMGMWVVGIDPTKAEAIPQFEEVLTKFSVQIGRLLYHKRRAPDERSLVSRVKSWFSGEKEDPVYRELKSVADLLEHYYDVLDTVFGQISAATIVYDSFGRVLKANELAFTLLKPENFVPTKGTALDFLRLVLGADELQLRRLLRNVLLERSTESMSVKLASQGDRQFVLRLYPLLEQKQARPGLDPFSVQGMICELMDTTSLSVLASLKGVVADRMGVELRNHLAAIQISAGLMEVDSISPAERQELIDAIYFKTNSCVQVIRECQKYLGRDLDAYAIRCFPVDALQVLGQVCSDLAQRADQQRVTFKTQQPRLMAQVLASSPELGRLFSSTIDLLLKDAAQDTYLNIEIDDEPYASTFRFSNSGFGLPHERLQEILTGPEDPDTEELRAMRTATLWVRDWGGSLEITSEVGKGYRVTLCLRHFPIAPLNPFDALIG